MSVSAPIIATAGRLNMTIALEFCLDHRDNLGMGPHQFCMGQHTSTARKVLKARTNQHQVIAGGGSTLTMSDKAYVTAPDGVSLTGMVTMAHSTHMRLRIVLDTLMGRYHPGSQVIDAVFQSLMEHETESEEYYLCDPHLKPKFSSFLTCWVQIRLSYWINHQWERGGGYPSPTCMSSGGRLNYRKLGNRTSLPSMRWRE